MKLGQSMAAVVTRADPWPQQTAAVAHLLGRRLQGGRILRVDLSELSAALAPQQGSCDGWPAFRNADAGWSRTP
jgi:hypothetical protein